MLILCCVLQNLVALTERDVDGKLGLNETDKRKFLDLLTHFQVINFFLN